MAKFHDALAAILGEDGALVDGWQDAVTAGYDEDMSIRDAAVGERDNQIAELTAAVSSLKNENYDLLKAVQSTVADTNPDVDEDGSDEDIDPIAALFDSED